MAERKEIIVAEFPEWDALLRAARAYAHHAFHSGAVIRTDDIVRRLRATNRHDAADFIEKEFGS